MEEKKTRSEGLEWIKALLIAFGLAALFVSFYSHQSLLTVFP